MSANSDLYPVVFLGLGSDGVVLPESDFVRIWPKVGKISLSSLVNEIIDEVQAPHVLLVRPNVVIDQGLKGAIDDLIIELDRDYPNWGVCGATGARWDGQKIYCYLRCPPRNPEGGVCARPVISIGSEIILLNLKRLRAEGVRISEHTSNWWEVGPLLALECLKRSLCVLADRRLMIVDPGKAPDIMGSESLKRFVSRNFLSHRLALPYGTIDIPNVTYSEFLTLPTSPHAKKDIVSCFDKALMKAREDRPIRLTIACRTQFNRQHLLERAMLSFAVAREEALSLCELRVVLVSDKDRDLMSERIEYFRSRFPALPLTALVVSSRSRETSRIDNLLGAITGIDSDYIWFVDDDDFVMPGAMRALARAIVPSAPLLVIGSSEVLEEAWYKGALVDFRPDGSYASSRVFDVFLGENYVPVCGMLLPVPLARERCQNVSATGEYLEDYFVLMRVLTGSRVEVESLSLPISGISLRGRENTVREDNRQIWNKSYGRFVGELVRSSDAVNPLYWQLGRR